MIEKPATNILPQSQFASGWTAGSNATQSINNAAAPDGTTTANLVTDNSTNGVHNVQQNLSFAQSTSYVISYFVKAGTLRYISVRGPTYATGNWPALTFDTLAQSIAANAGVSSSGFQVLANGWFRVWMISTTSSSVSVDGTSVGGSNVATAPLITAPSNSYVGSGQTFYAWGAQIEAGTTPTSYVPTTSAAASRSADSIAISGVLATTLAASTGTVVAGTNSSQQSVAATLIDANGTVLLGKTAGNIGTTAVGATLSTGNTGTWTGVNDLGLAWNASGGAIQLNGGTIATDTTARTPSATFHLGSTSGSSAFFNGYFTRLTAYATKQASPQ